MYFGQLTSAAEVITFVFAIFSNIQYSVKTIFV
jgi:hypothetical protein